MMHDEELRPLNHRSNPNLQVLKNFFLRIKAMDVSSMRKEQ